MGRREAGQLRSGDAYTGNRRAVPILNYLLSRDAAVSVLSDEGAQLCQKMTDDLINNGLYTSLTQAGKQLPVEGKSSPTLPLILSLITLPLTTSSPSPALLLSIFRQILTTPLLPNHLPLSDGEEEAFEWRW
ncbi:hypothetical protein BJ165DRAFT_179554 [Panaeolus papilionaceus]|nr:hypothetical protein BJ165DRAFT_179554 [Panaeolus papilionaceus]